MGKYNILCIDDIGRLVTKVRVSAVNATLTPIDFQVYKIENTYINESSVKSSADESDPLGPAYRVDISDEGRRAYEVNYRGIAQDGGRDGIQNDMQKDMPDDAQKGAQGGVRNGAQWGTPGGVQNAAQGGVQIGAFGFNPAREAGQSASPRLATPASHAAIAEYAAFTGQAAKTERRTRVSQSASFSSFAPAVTVVSRADSVVENNPAYKLDISKEGLQASIRVSGPCKTCSNRKYVDVSGDASVSFKSPTHISPEAAPAMVAAHESEHVSNERAYAAKEGRRIVNQTVSISTGICPECGRIYVSGGVTQTTSVKESKPQQDSDDTKTII